MIKLHNIFINIFINEKSFYKSAFALVLPAIASNAMSILLSFSDIFMLGRLGSESEVAISGATIANQPFFLFTMLMFGSMSGATVLCAQYWGKRDLRAINAITGTAILFLTPICVIFMLACFFLPEQIMSLMSNDSAVIAAAASYLKIVLFSYICELIVSLFSGILRSVENVKVPTLIALAGIIINIFLNIALIYGMWGFPALGIIGAAIGTLVAQIVKAISILIYVIFFEKTLRLNLKEMFAIKWILVRDFFKYGLPVIANEFIWGFGWSVHGAIIGHISKEQYAAYTIANMADRLATISMIGFSSACCVIIGKAIGAGEDREKIVKYSNTFYMLAFGFGIVTASLTFFSRNLIVNLFEVGFETKAFASSILIMLTCFVLLRTFNCVSIVGVFRGGGDTKSGMIIDTCTMYLVGIPAGFIAMYFLKLDVTFVYACLISDEIAKFPLVIRRVRSKKWIKNITREF